MHILIVYGSLEGQTEKIAMRLAETIRQKGYLASAMPVKRLAKDFALDDYSAIVIGGSIHMGKYPKDLKPFVITHRDWLNNHPSALFTVCMAIHSQREKSRQEAAHYQDKFIKQTGWHPRFATMFAGAVKYTQYNFITRFIMKMISKKEGGSIDTSRDHEYTDWNAVELFAEEILK